MKTVVITGNARGFGYAMTELFRKKNFNVVLCDINSDALKIAKEKLEKIDSKGKILSFKTDITDEKDINNLINGTLNEVKTIDIWINNAGVNQTSCTILGLSIYGTSKRAVTYFTESLAYEASKLNTGVLIGKITPGIMITNFINTSLGDGEKIELDEKTKKIYNILGDYPETIANFMVDKIVNNTKNNVKFAWLTNRRAALRFMTSPFNKRDFFSN